MLLRRGMITPRQIETYNERKARKDDEIKTGNSFQAEGAKAIGEVLKKNNALVKLDLWSEETQHNHDKKKSFVI